MYTIKKIAAAAFHNANKLNGQRATASYRLFQDGQEVGTVIKEGQTGMLAFT